MVHGTWYSMFIVLFFQMIDRCLKSNLSRRDCEGGERETRVHVVFGVGSYMVNVRVKQLHMGLSW